MKKSLLIITACVICLLLALLTACAGPAGERGADGSIVTIGENGNWFIDGVDTGVSARGETGAEGKPGTAGSVVTIGENGNWFIDGVDTGVSARGEAGAEGKPGTAGSIVTIGENGNWFIDGVDTGVRAGCDCKCDCDCGNNNDGGDDTVRSFSAVKRVSHTAGKTAYPAHLIEYKNEYYRGDLITYTVEVSNTGDAPIEINISDVIPEGTRGVSGVTDGAVSASFTLAVGESRSISYTVEITEDVPATGVILSEGATVNGVSLPSDEVFVMPTFNEVDRAYVTLAIRVLAKSTWQSTDLASRIYTAAFTNSTAFTGVIKGTPEELIEKIESGSDAALLGAVAPTLFGGAELSPASGLRGTGGTLTSEGLIAGDLLITRTGDTVLLYVYDGVRLYDITSRAVMADNFEVISSTASADAWAVIRPSAVMTSFTPSDPDESAEVLSDKEEAIVKTAEAFFLRGESLQYEDTYFGNTSKSGEHRWEVGVNSPEDSTYNEWNYTNCAAFTYDVYFNTFGYKLPSNMYTTANLEKYSEGAGMRVDIPGYTGYTKGYTDAEMLAVEAAFLETLRPGDIMVIRRLSGSGHAMLYLGCGKFIHSGGSVFSFAGGVGTEVDEASIRYARIHDYFFTEGSGGYLFYRDEDHAHEFGSAKSPITALFIVRPLNDASIEIPENSANRVENLSGVRVDKLSSHASSTAVNPGDTVTFSFYIYNTNDYEVTLDIYERLPANTAYLSGCDAITGDELTWRVTVGAADTAVISYTVRVSGEYGASVYGDDATVGGVKVACPEIAIARVLTESERAAILSAISDIKSEGTELTGLALINEIYYRALGVEGIFATTDANEVMAGEDGVFRATSATISGKAVNTLNEAGAYYRDMLARSLYGGYRVNTSDVLGERTRILTKHNLMVGDVLIGRTSSSEQVLIYVGDGVFLATSTGLLTPDTTDFDTRCERLLFFGRDFAVLRPSYVLDEISE